MIGDVAMPRKTPFRLGTILALFSIAQLVPARPSSPTLFL